jgi:anion-transporting  ArsA/GET3 family ATPase
MKKFFEHISRYAAGAATWATLHNYMLDNKKNELLENKKMMENIQNSVEIIRKSSEEMQERLNQENIEKLTSLSNNFKNKIDNAVNTANKIQEINTQIMKNDSNISGDLKTQSYQDINNNLDLTKNGLEEGKKILDEIINIFSNIKGSGSSSNYIFNIINQYNDFLNTLTVVQKGALGHLLAAIFILLCFTSIITIFYGDILIKYFEIEKRFTKIARFIEIRRKFQQYYFFLNTCLILSTLFLIIYVNSVVLFF